MVARNHPLVLAFPQVTKSLFPYFGDLFSVKPSLHQLMIFYLAISWISPGFLHILSQINDIGNFPVNTNILQLHKNYSIKIAQLNIGGKFIYSVTINGHVYFSIENQKPRNHGKVFVYTSDPWYDTFGQSGTLSNLEIQGY